MILVGLTGGIGCGKSTVADVIKSRKVALIDADKIAREVVEPGKPAYQKLRQTFGSEYFDDETGALLREKLGDVVFNDAAQRKKLNTITHPAIKMQIFYSILYHLFTGSRYVVLDIPLLFESGMNKLVQKVLVVHCSRETQIERLCQRDKITREQAEARLSAQLPTDVKIKGADYLIDNSGSKEETGKRVNEIIDQLDSLRSPTIIRLSIVAILFSIGFVTKRMLFSN